MLRLENHTVYESAKILREKWVLELDNGNTIYVQFLTDDMDRNTYQVTHRKVFYLFIVYYKITNGFLEGKVRYYN